MLPTCLSVFLLFLSTLSALAQSEITPNFDRTYALLVRGGTEGAMENDQRYAYNTFRNLGLKEEHMLAIAPHSATYRQAYGDLIAKQESADFLKEWPRFLSKFDFNGDGRSDLYADLSEANIHQAISRLGKLDKADGGASQWILHLGAHGSKNEYGGLIHLKGSLDHEYLFASQLAQWLDAEADSDTQVIIFVTACYSGSWAPYFKGPNRILITSADEEHVSWMGCVDGEDCSFFDRNFFSALGGQDRWGRKVEADSNKDGVTSFREAYDWSESKHKEESIPIEQVEGIPFNHVKFYEDHNLGQYRKHDSMYAPYGNMFMFFRDPRPKRFVTKNGDVPQYYGEKDALLGVTPQ